jgi:hypothetical protein
MAYLFQFRSDAFKPLIPPEAYIVGPAFPEPFPFGILPPVCGKIANNRRVPKYSLGWVLSEDDFLDKYDPEDKYSDVINAWSAELDNEWMGNYPEELKYVSCSLVSRRQRSSTRYAAPRLICYDLGWLSRYLIRIATNKDVVAIERSKDRSLVARGKQVLGINEDPVWYKMP